MVPVTAGKLAPTIIIYYAKMKPTATYIATPEQIKSRHEAQSGPLTVTIENIGEQSFIYVSHDGGVNHTILGWNCGILAQLSIWYHGLPWPPTRIRTIKSLDDQKLTILYIDPQWSEPDLYAYATYNFNDKKWRLKIE
jgi:hypothetical protein